jgi:hypothetical protein
MARRILVLFLLITITFSAQFEFIKTFFNGTEITSAYINNKEVFSLYGKDQSTLERLVSIISKIQLFSELNYSKDSIRWVKENNKHLLYWDNTIIDSFTKDELSLNNKRRNNLINLANIFENKNSERVDLVINSVETNFNKLKLIKKDLFSLDGTLVGIHSQFTPGTMLRLHNNDNDWTVVIRIIENNNSVNDKVLFVNDNVIRALGVREGEVVNVNVL